MSSSNKVGELFKAAGRTLNQLGDLTLQLQPAGEQAVSSGKWTDAEIDMLMASIKQFSEDLNKISDTIKQRTIAQIRTQMKRKAYDEANVPLSLSSTIKTIPLAGSKQQIILESSNLPISVVNETLHVKSDKSAEVTLSELNATDFDIDIEALAEHHLTSKKLKVDRT